MRAVFLFAFIAPLVGSNRVEIEAHEQGGWWRTPVASAWDNHFSAFGGQNIDQILQDYSENSVINVYDQTAGSLTVFTGINGARACFTGLFARLSDTSDLAAPVQEVHEATDDQPGSVFLIWRCPASGFAEATDTFIFDDDAKILRQNVVVTDTQANRRAYPSHTVGAADGSSHGGPVHGGWDNHFAAFGGQNVEMILADYTEESVITVYNQLSGEKNVFEGLSGVRDCFTGLFAALHDTSELGAPIQHVEEGDSAQVFLIWRAPSSGFTTGTDTFIFNSAGKILRQNVVVHQVGAGPVKGPCSSYFGNMDGVVSVADPDVGHTGASAPYCTSNGMSTPCIYMHLAGAANECQSPGPPDGCHRYYKVKYSECDELQTFNFEARIDTTGAFSTDGVFIACADRVISSEAKCYGPPANLPVECECPESVLGFHLANAVSLARQGIASLQSPA